MKRTVVQTGVFSRCLDELIQQKRIAETDLEAFEKMLVENPKLGKAIPGLSGLRKIRLKGKKKEKAADSG